MFQGKDIESVIFSLSETAVRPDKSSTLFDGKAKGAKN
jgi:hypothetical protein